MTVRCIKIVVSCPRERSCSQETPNSRIFFKVIEGSSYVRSGEWVCHGNSVSFTTVVYRAGDKARIVVDVGKVNREISLV